MKKLFSVLLVAAVALGVSSFTFAPARNAVFVSAAAAAEVSAQAEDDPALRVEAKSAYLVDYNTGTVLYAYNENGQYPIASMCKIMTLLLTFEHIDSGALGFDSKIAISDEAAHMGGSQAFLDAGAEYVVSDLIKSVVIASANDSSVALAETVAGNQDLFVQKMNARAKELGMENTVFVNCTGLPAPGQHSTAKDVSRMTRELLKHKEYYNYTRIWMDDFKHPSGRVTGLTNTNKLIRFYKGCDSGKTGYTSEAGHCLSASALRDGMRLVATIIGAKDSKCRFRDISAMFNYGFSTFTNREILSKDKPLDIKVKVRGGKTQEISVQPSESYYEFCKKSEKPGEISFEYQLADGVKAPVAVGDAVGKLMVVKNGSVVKELEVVSMDAVEKATLGDIISRVLERWKLF